MALPTTAFPLSEPEPITPFVLINKNGNQSVLLLERSPITIGRKPDRDICIEDARMSREHAQIVREGEDFYIEDPGSKLGTFVNGTRITRQKLARNDRIEFGQSDIAQLVFHPSKGDRQKPTESDVAHDLLTHIIEPQPSGEAADLERLTLFLEAARKLNTARVLDDILVTLIEATLRITHAERGFVFLKEKQGTLKLAAGLDAKGRKLSEDRTISHSILNKAVTSGSEFVVTDTTSSADLAGQMSIVQFDLRTVICIPLLRRTGLATDVSGALYLDARHTSRNLTTVSSDLLRTIAHEAAALVENAELMQEQERARRYEQELAISATIQQRLMAVKIPDTSFARLKARNIACKDIGGDFYDVVVVGDSMTAVVTDVCGKGVSAALLASILQGMIYAQLKSSVPIAEIADVTNRFLCHKELGEKYATLAMVRVESNGSVEMLNCGHVPPWLVCNGKVQRTQPQNPPVGLINGIPYTTERFQLAPGDRVVIVTDGITEAQNADGDFFGEDRLEEAIALNSFEKVFAQVQGFCGETPFNDDCTVLELEYQAS